MAMCVLRNAHADLLIFENNEIIINITNYKPKLIIKSSLRKGGVINTPTS
jgi:hypothetical protein